MWSVHVDDELAGGPVNAACVVCASDLPLDHPLVKRVDTDDEWPAWEFGF